MKKSERAASPDFVPIRLAAAVTIVGVAHISVIVFVFLKNIRNWNG